MAVWIALTSVLVIAAASDSFFGASRQKLLYKSQALNSLAFLCTGRAVCRGRQDAGSDDAQDVWYVAGGRRACPALPVAGNLVAIRSFVALLPVALFYILSTLFSDK